MTYTGESQAPATVSHGEEHGTPRPCRPTELPRPASLSAPRPHCHFSFLPVRASSPMFTVSLHGTWHISEHQRPVRAAQAASHLLMCRRGPRKLFSGPFFFLKERAAMVTQKAHNAGDTASVNRSEVGATTSGSVYSEHGNEDHAQCGMNTGTRGRGHTLQLVVGSRKGPSQSTLSTKPQAPASPAGAQGGCHHNPGRASQSTGLWLPNTHTAEGTASRWGDCRGSLSLSREPLTPVFQTEAQAGQTAHVARGRRRDQTALSR